MPAGHATIKGQMLISCILARSLRASPHTLHTLQLSSSPKITIFSNPKTGFSRKTTRNEARQKILRASFPHSHRAKPGFPTVSWRFRVLTKGLSITKRRYACRARRDSDCGPPRPIWSRCGWPSPIGHGRREGLPRGCKRRRRPSKGAGGRRPSAPMPAGTARQRAQAVK